MNLHRRQLQQRWLLALGVVAVLVHLLATPLMARAMARTGQPSGLDRFAMALCTTAPRAHDAAGDAFSAPTGAVAHAHADAATHDHTPADHRCCDLCGACNTPAATGHGATLLPAAPAAGLVAGSVDAGLPPRHAAHAPHAPRAPPSNV